MSALLIPSIPYLLAIAAALLLAGPPLRPGLIGIVLVSLATAAASRVPGGTPSFHVINNSLLGGGLLLFLAAGALALRGGRAVPFPVASGPARPATQPVTSGGIAILRRWGLAVLLSLLLLPALWFVFTVAGPDARSLQGLRDAPFSPAGETLLAALLLPASLVLAGIWPFGVVTGGPRLAPLAALLLLLVVWPMVGDGLAHWRSLYAAWLVLAAFVAAASAGWPRVMACAGLFAIACGGEPSSWAGMALTIIASLLSLRPATSGTTLRVACLGAGACGIAALRATLANEVVYSVLMLLAVVVGVLRMRLRAAIPA